MTILRLRQYSWETGKLTNRTELDTWCGIPNQTRSYTRFRPGLMKHSICCDSQAGCMSERPVQGWRKTVILRNQNCRSPRTAPRLKTQQMSTPSIPQQDSDRNKDGQTNKANMDDCNK
eukprot:631271-Hanusia_phi.AAC.1